LFEEETRRPLKFRSDQTLARVEKQGDLFEPVETLKQKLPKKWDT
jgi:hypothetical protein